MLRILLYIKARFMPFAMHLCACWKRLRGSIQPTRQVTKEDRKAFERIQRIFPPLQKYNMSSAQPVLNRAREVGCDDLEQYYEYLQKNETEADNLKTRLTYQSETFFRGNDWPFFCDFCLSDLAGSSEVSAWSAACANGQEVYSLVLALMDQVPLSGVDVLASDYDDKMLDNCRTGLFPTYQLNQIPRRYWRHAIDLGGGLHPRFTFSEEIKARIHTRNINLLTDPFPEGFDVILCRNVLKFFSEEAIPEVQKKLADALKPGGFLFLSTDGEKNTKELIADPEAMGLRQIAGRCIYRKIE